MAYQLYATASDHSDRCQHAAASCQCKLVGVQSSTVAHASAAASHAMPQRQQPQSHSHATHTTKSRCAHDDSAAPLSWTRLVLPGTRPRAAQNRVPGPPALATCACRRLGRLHTATRSAHSQTRVAWRGWRGTYMHSQCAGPHRRPQHGDTHGSGSVPPARRFIRVVACAHSVPIRAHAARQRHAATAACHIAAAAHDRCGSVLAKLLHLHARTWPRHV